MDYWAGLIVILFLTDWILLDNFATLIRWLNWVYYYRPGEERVGEALMDLVAANVGAESSSSEDEEEGEN